VYIRQSEHAFRDGLKYVGSTPRCHPDPHRPHQASRRPGNHYHDVATARRSGSDADRLSSDLIEADLANDTRGENK
ncbi:MAG: hypothetical protein ACRDS9_09570, partial [Pseudonocardiaceae bacterium]